MLGSPQEGGDQTQILFVRKEIHTWIRDRVEGSPSIAVKGLMGRLDRWSGLTRFIKPFKDNVNKAGWYGTTLCGGRCLDVNRTVFYSDKKETSEITIRTLLLSDGWNWVGGERDGADLVRPDHSEADGVTTRLLSDAVGSTLYGF